jgi:hypothetical protein
MMNKLVSLRHLISETLTEKSTLFLVKIREIYQLDTRIQVLFITVLSTHTY